MIPLALALPTIVLLGICIGSFLNVVIARLPMGRSLVHPASACPRCGGAIAWYDNIPILSFLVLRARCRSCGASISWRYPAVEALTGGLFVLAYLRFGWSVDLVAALILLTALVAIAGIDLDHQIIPDIISLPGAAIGFFLSLAPGRLGWLDSAVGIFVGGGVFIVIIVASSWLLGQPGMGIGDVKLGAMLGAFLGWKLVLLAALLSVLVGGPLAAALLATGRKGRRDPVPFGPFLALGGTASLLGGEAILAWYFGQFLG